MALSAAGLQYGGAGPMMMPQAPQQPRFTAGPSGDAGPSGPASARSGSGAAPLGLGGDGLQRVLTGDYCTTLSWEIGSEQLDVARWNEEESSCQVLNSHSATFLVTALGAAALASSDSTELGKLPEGVSACAGGPESDKKGDQTAIKSLTVLISNDGELLVHGNKVDPTFLVSHLVVKCLESSAPPKKDGPKGKKKGSRGGSSGVPTLTLVLPCSFTFDHSIRAAKAINKTGCSLKNIFNRGIATVAFQVVSNRKGLNLDESSGGGEEELVLLYVYANKGTGAVEAALVHCELLSTKGVAKANKSKDVTRLWCSGLADGKSFNELSVVVDRVLALGGDSSKRRLYACVAAGDDEGVAETRKLKCVKDSSTLFLRAGSADAVQGGCLLSAAELDSSKQYAMLEDGSWTTLYQMPVADGLLTSDIGWRVCASEKDTGTAELVFTAGTRMIKKDVGVVGSNLLSMPVTVGKKEFENKSKDEKGTWPRLELLSRLDSKSSWNVFATTSPLSAGGDDGGVENCTLVLNLDPATGHVRPVVHRGHLLRTLRRSRQWWIRAGLTIVMILSFVASVKFAFDWKEKRDFQQKVDWLVDFYREHAPEKLENMTQVERTISHFQGKLWSLQKQLETKYKVKMLKKAPEAIGEL